MKTQKHPLIILFPGLEIWAQTQRIINRFDPTRHMSADDVVSEYFTEIFTDYEGSVDALDEGDQE